MVAEQPKAGVCKTLRGNPLVGANPTHSSISMGYDYIETKELDVQLDSPYQPAPLGVVIANILKDTRHILSIDVWRDDKAASKFHVKYRNLEHGVTY